MQSQQTMLLAPTCFRP